VTAFGAWLLCLCRRTGAAKAEDAMHLDLTLHEATLVDRQLLTRIDELERAVMRTVNPLRVEQLAREMADLKVIEHRLARESETLRTEDDIV